MDIHSGDSRLKLLLGEIEALRMKRQRELAHRDHPFLKRFTQQELNDEAFPSYKNLLVGRSHRMPDRQAIIHIAQYLESATDECNDLLLVAGYNPIKIELEGQSLERALDWARKTMKEIPFPAMIVTHTQDIKGFNEPFRRLFDIRTDYSYGGLMNRIDFHFNFDLPIRPRSTFDKASFELWEAHAIQGIYAIKREHMLSRYDTWYKELFDRIRKYKVEEYLNVVDLEETADQMQSILARTENSGVLIPIRYRQIAITSGSRAYPQIEVFLPADAAARKVFQELGCPAHFTFA